MCKFSFVMRGKIVKLSVTCKINWAASKNLQRFVYCSSAKSLKQLTKPRLSEENWDISQQRTKFIITKTPKLHYNIITLLYNITITILGNVCLYCNKSSVGIQCKKTLFGSKNAETPRIGSNRLIWVKLLNYMHFSFIWSNISWIADPGTFRNTDVENQEPTGDHSQNDPHPEVEFSVCQSRNSIDSDPEEASHIIIWNNSKSFG